MWISGLNSWSRVGYSIGTPALNNCFNISNSGAITIDHRLITPLLYSTKIKASNATVITLEDDVLIIGNLVVNGSSKYKPYWIAGKVNTNGSIRATKGRYAFTRSRASVGLYTIRHNGSTPFSDNNYRVVKLSLLMLPLAL